MKMVHKKITRFHRQTLQVAIFAIFCVYLQLMLTPSSYAINDEDRFRTATLHVLSNRVDLIKRHDWNHLAATFDDTKRDAKRHSDAIRQAVGNQTITDAYYSNVEDTPNTSSGTPYPSEYIRALLIVDVRSHSGKLSAISCGHWELWDTTPGKVRPRQSLDLSRPIILPTSPLVPGGSFIGRWQYNQSGDNIDFYKDGTLSITGRVHLALNYRVLDKSHIRVSANGAVLGTGIDVWQIKPASPIQTNQSLDARHYGLLNNNIRLDIGPELTFALLGDNRYELRPAQQ